MRSISLQSSLMLWGRDSHVSSKKEPNPLAELQKQLKPGEAYYRMTNVGEAIYAVLVTPGAARGARLDLTTKQLDEQVLALRDTISTVENGQRMTYAFDVGLSHQLYTEL